MIGSVSIIKTDSMMVTGSVQARKSLWRDLLSHTHQYPGQEIQSQGTKMRDKKRGWSGSEREFPITSSLELFEKCLLNNSSKDAM